MSILKLNNNNLPTLLQQNSQVLAGDPLTLPFGLSYYCIISKVKTAFFPLCRQYRWCQFLRKSKRGLSILRLLQATGWISCLQLKSCVKFYFNNLLVAFFSSNDSRRFASLQPKNISSEMQNLSSMPEC